MAVEHEDLADQAASAPDAEAAGTPAVAESDGAEPEGTPDTAGAGSRAPWRRNPFLFAASVLLACAVAAACVFGGLWASAALGGDAHYSQVRNHVLQVAKGAAVDFTSVDYRHLDAYTKRAEESTTGSLHKTLDTSIGKYTDQLSKARLVVNGSVMQAALSSLNLRTGTASALVVVKAVTTRKGKKPSTRRLPMTLNLTRVGSGWKVSGLGGRDTGAGALPGQ